MSRSETRLSTFVRSVFSPSSGGISNETVANQRKKSLSRFVANRARWYCAKPLRSPTSLDVVRDDAPRDGGIGGEERGGKEAEEANAEDDGGLVEKATPKSSKVISRIPVFLKQVVSTSSPKLPGKMDGGCEPMRSRNYPDCSWHRFTADWGCKNRRTRPPMSGRPAAGPRRGPVVGRNPLVWRGPQGRAPVAHCGVWPSVCHLNRKNDFCPRAHYCLPVIIVIMRILRHGVLIDRV